jgi:hypothetical protein
MNEQCEMKHPWSGSLKHFIKCMNVKNLYVHFDMKNFMYIFISWYMGMLGLTVDDNYVEYGKVIVWRNKDLSA